MQKKIILHGGIGNQLFQWAYGHNIQQTIGEKCKFITFRKEHKLNHLYFNLGDLIKDCSHGDFAFKNISKIPLLSRIGDPLQKFSYFSMPPKKLFDSRQHPFSNALNLNSQYQLGYFQNVQFVKQVYSFVIDELRNSLDQIANSIHEERLEDYVIVHVRRADTMSEANINRVGVLSADYYESLPIEKNSQVIVLTDDLKGALKVTKNLNVSKILSPAELNVFETLKVMSKARIFFGANSTLSWWGALLSTHHGGLAYLPEPFFKGFSHELGTALNLPQFILVAAKFL
jgi:hypothetical protein